MRYLSCLRYVLVGLVLIAAATPAALALCWKIVPGAGASGTQSGWECVGACTSYIDCAEGDVCQTTLTGAKTCTTAPGPVGCTWFTRGITLPGSMCCTAGIPQGASGTVMVPIATASGACFFGIGIGLFGPEGYPYPGRRP